MPWILASCAAPPEPRHFTVPYPGAPLPVVEADASDVLWEVVPSVVGWVEHERLNWGSAGDAELFATVGDRTERWTFTALPLTPENEADLAALLDGYMCGEIFVYGPRPTPG